MDAKIKKAMETVSQALDGTILGDRHIVVLDRGWIFVGNLSCKDDLYSLTDCKNIRYFKKVGFGGLTKGAKSAEAVLDACEPIQFRESAMIFKTPVRDDWDA